MNWEWDLVDVIFNWVRSRALKTMTLEGMEDLAHLLEENFKIEKKELEKLKPGTPDARD